MELQVFARVVYRMRAARDDERGVTVRLVVDMNQVGADLDDLADTLRGALQNFVQDATGSFIDKIEVVETSLHTPDPGYFDRILAEDARD